MGRVSDARGRLVSVALQLMRERSYGAVGVDAMCHQAGINKGSFYHFFAAKSELTVAALENYWDSLRRNLMEPTFAPDVPPLDRISRFFEQVYQQHKAYQRKTGHVCGCLFGSLGGELSSQDERIRAKIDEILGRIRAYFETAIADAQRRGEIEVANAQQTARALVAFMEGMLLQAKVSNNPEVFRELAPHALAMLSPRHRSQKADADGFAASEGAAAKPSPPTLAASAASVQTSPNLDILD